jgi:hypothetical protein
MLVIYQESLYDAQSTKCKIDFETCCRTVHFHINNILAVFITAHLKHSGNCMYHLLQSSHCAFFPHIICTLFSLSEKYGGNILIVQPYSLN